MAGGGRALVRAALIALALGTLALSTPARADPRAEDEPALDLPACETLDVESVRRLLLLEVGERAMRGIRLRLDADACDADAARASFSISDEAGLHAEGWVPLAPLETRERALGLALAERLRLFAARREVVDVTPRARVERSVASPAEVHAPGRGAVTLGAHAIGRWFPLGASWMSGGGASVRLTIAEPLFAAIELGAEGTRAEGASGAVDLWALEAALALGLEARIATDYSLDAGARASVMLANATGWPREGPPASAVRPLVALEAVAAVWWWLDPHVALGIGVSGGALVLGLVVDGVDRSALDLSGLLLSATIGVRFAP